MTNPPPTALQTAELRALAVGREPIETLDRLKAIVRLLESDADLGEGDRELVSRMRHVYGHELAELKDPEV